MKKFTSLLLTLLALIVVVTGATAEDAPACKGLLKALQSIPADKPGYAEVLELAQEQCGEALDRAALVALYESTNGDGWEQRGNWLDESVHHCDGWYEVICDGEGRVSRLDLDHNNLRGPLPPELGNMSKLIILELGANVLDGPIPPEMGNMSSLTRISIYESSLSGSLPAELGKLSNLRFLNMDSNQLTGPIPAELGNLSSLTSLRIGENKLTGPIPAALGNLSNLRHLYISHNQLTCWETADLLAWANQLYSGYWDYPNPGQLVCPADS